MLDQASLDWFAELNRGLRDELDDAGFKARMRETTAQLQALAAEIVADRARGSSAAGSRAACAPCWATTCRVSPGRCCSRRSRRDRSVAA